MLMVAAGLLVSDGGSGNRARSKPRVVILSTGGTIAGRGLNPSRTTEYEAGALDVSTLMQSIAGLDDAADIRGEQVASIDSSHITNQVLLRLALRVQETVNRDDVDGVVVTHGTDTMEESAYFLSLVVSTDKPVVLTGAMRPSTSISADGPLNLLNAVTVAASTQAGGRGVLVAMNQQIHAARFVAKTHTTDVAAFQSPDFGPVGRVIDGTVQFAGSPSRRHTNGSEFSVEDGADLPRVDIIYAHGHHNRDPVDWAVRAGARGIVHAGMGCGMVFPETYQALKEAAAGGVAVVRASRVGRGPVTPHGNDQTDGMIPAGDLNPQKARILLMLALTKTGDPVKIRRIFEEY